MPKKKDTKPSKKKQKKLKYQKQLQKIGHRRSQIQTVKHKISKQNYISLPAITQIPQTQSQVPCCIAVPANFDSDNEEVQLPNYNISNSNQLGGDLSGESGSNESGSNESGSNDLIGVGGVTLRGHIRTFKLRKPVSPLKKHLHLQTSKRKPRGGRPPSKLWPFYANEYIFNETTQKFDKHTGCTSIGCGQTWINPKAEYIRSHPLKFVCPFPQKGVQIAVNELIESKLGQRYRRNGILELLYGRQRARSNKLFEKSGVSRDNVIINVNNPSNCNIKDILINKTSNHGRNHVTNNDVLGSRRDNEIEEIKEIEEIIDLEENNNSNNNNNVQPPKPPPIPAHVYAKYFDFVGQQIKTENDIKMENNNNNSDCNGRMSPPNINNLLPTNNNDKLIMEQQINDNNNNNNILYPGQPINNSNNLFIRRPINNNNKYNNNLFMGQPISNNNLFMAQPINNNNMTQPINNNNMTQPINNNNMTQPINNKNILFMTSPINNNNNNNNDNNTLFMTQPINNIHNNDNFCMGPPINNNDNDLFMGPPINNNNNNNNKNNNHYGVSMPALSIPPLSGNNSLIGRIPLPLPPNINNNGAATTEMCSTMYISDGDLMEGGVDSDPCYSFIRKQFIDDFSILTEKQSIQEALNVSLYWHGLLTRGPTNQWVKTTFYDIAVLICKYFAVSGKVPTMPNSYTLSEIVGNDNIIMIHDGLNKIKKECGFVYINVDEMKKAKISQCCTLMSTGKGSKQCRAIENLSVVVDKSAVGLLKQQKIIADPMIKNNIHICRFMSDGTATMLLLQKLYCEYVNKQMVILYNTHIYHKTGRLTCLPHGFEKVLHILSNGKFWWNFEPQLLLLNKLYNDMFGTQFTTIMRKYLGYNDDKRISKAVSCNRLEWARYMLLVVDWLLNYNFFQKCLTDKDATNYIFREVIEEVLSEKYNDDLRMYKLYGGIIHLAINDCNRTDAAEDDGLFHINQIEIAFSPHLLIECSQNGIMCFIEDKRKEYSDKNEYDFEMEESKEEKELIDESKEIEDGEIYNEYKLMINKHGLTQKLVLKNNDKDFFVCQDFLDGNIVNVPRALHCSICEEVKKYLLYRKDKDLYNCSVAARFYTSLKHRKNISTLLHKNIYFRDAVVWYVEEMGEEHKQNIIKTLTCFNQVLSPFDYGYFDPMSEDSAGAWFSLRSSNNAFLGRFALITSKYFHGQVGNGDVERVIRKLGLMDNSCAKQVRSMQRELFVKHNARVIYDWYNDL